MRLDEEVIMDFFREYINVSVSLTSFFFMFFLILDLSHFFQKVKTNVRHVTLNWPGKCQSMFLDGCQDKPSLHGSWAFNGPFGIVPMLLPILCDEVVFETLLCITCLATLCGTVPLKICSVNLLSKIITVLFCFFFFRQ